MITQYTVRSRERSQSRFSTWILRVARTYLLIKFLHSRVSCFRSRPTCHWELWLGNFWSAPSTCRSRRISVNNMPSVTTIHSPTNLSKNSTPAIKATVITFCGRIPESCDTACSAIDIAWLKSGRVPTSHLEPELVKILHDRRSGLGGIRTGAL
jgi:hypothetical protein